MGRPAHARATFIAREGWAVAPLAREHDDDNCCGKMLFPSPVNLPRLRKATNLPRQAELTLFFQRPTQLQVGCGRRNMHDADNGVPNAHRPLRVTQVRSFNSKCRTHTLYAIKCNMGDLRWRVVERYSVIRYPLCLAQSRSLSTGQLTHKNT